MKIRIEISKDGVCALKQSCEKCGTWEKYSFSALGSTNLLSKERIIAKISEIIDESNVLK